MGFFSRTPTCFGPSVGPVILALFLTATTLMAQAPERRYRLELTGAKDLTGTTVMVVGEERFFAVGGDGFLFSPLDPSLKDFPFAPGEVTFEIVHPRGRLTRTLTFGPNAPLRQVLDLTGLGQKKTETRKLEAVDVNRRGGRDDLSRTVLTATEARLIPGSGGDVLRSVMNFPGVAPGPVFQSGLFIRGGDRFDILYTYDGMRIGNPFHSIGFYSVFPNGSLDNVEFYPGAFPARFGNSQGAVIEVMSKTSHTPGFHGELDGNLAVAGGNLDIPLGKNAHLLIGGRRTYYEFYLDLIRSIDIPALGDVKKALSDFYLVPFFWDLNAKMDVNLNPTTRLSVLAIASRDSLKLNVNRFPSPDDATNHLSFSLEREESWNTFGVTLEGNNGKLRHQWALFRYENSNSQAFEGVNLFSARTINTSLVNQWGLKLGKTWDLGAGLELIYQQYPFSVPDFKPGSESFRNTSLSLATRLKAFQDAATNLVTVTYDTPRPVGALWFEAAATFGAFTLTPSLRGTWNGVNGLFDVDPRLTVSAKIGKKVDLYGKVGLYTQLPQLLWVSDRFGSQNLPSAQSLHSVLGAQVDALGFDFRLEGYLKSMERQPLNNPAFDAVFPSSPDNPRYVATGKGSSSGIEFMARRGVSDRLFGWLSYALSRSDRYGYGATNMGWVTSPANFSQNNGGAYSNLPMEWSVFAKDVTHNLTLIASYDLVPKKLRLGLRVSASSGNPYTLQLVDGFVTNVPVVVGPVTNLVPVTNFNVVDSPQYLGERFPWRLTIDFRIDYTIRIANRVDLTIYADLWNLQDLFGYKNLIAYNYPRQNWKLSDVGKPAAKDPFYDLPFLPLLGILISF